MNRQLAIKILSADVFGTKQQTAEAICMAIEALQEQKKGKWIKYDGRFKYNWICSECDSCSDERTDYCPMCGARMEV